MKKILSLLYKHVIVEAINRAFIVLIPPALSIFLLRMFGSRIGRGGKIYTPLVFVNTAFANLSIGNDCHIGRDVCLDTYDAISIGDNVTISMRCTLLTHMMTGIERLERNGYANDSGNIRIHDNVYIGAGSTILHNVEIGRNCVIGASSLIISDVPENSVVVGIPGKVIKIIKP